MSRARRHEVGGRRAAAVVVTVAASVRRGRRRVRSGREAAAGPKPGPGRAPRPPGPFRERDRGQVPGHAGRGDVRGPGGPQ